MSLAAIRDQIKTIIVAADADSIVHDYERWANTPDTIKALFQPVPPQAPVNSPLRAWIVTLKSSQDEPLTFTQVRTRYTFTLRFVYSLQDATASEKTMLAAVEAVRAAFRTDHTLNGAALSTTVRGSAGAGLPRAQTVMVASFLVHVAELELVAEEINAA